MKEITIEQLGELIFQAKSGRVTRELLQAFLRNPQSVNAKLSQEYVVSVDYGMSLADMIAAGQYDWKNSGINADNFLVTGEGVVETKVKLVHLSKVVSMMDEVEAELDKMGLRPATLAELLAFGATYPEIQREFPIVCLDSFWGNPDGDRFVPYLSRSGFERSLDLYWFVDGWGGNCRFLAVCK